MGKRGQAYGSEDHFLRYRADHTVAPNRLTCLYFLTQVARIPARLVFVYFYGDDFRDGTPCPSTEAEWRVVINACHLTLGLSEPHPLSDFVGEVFLPPCPRWCANVSVTRSSPNERAIGGGFPR